MKPSSEEESPTISEVNQLGSLQASPAQPNPREIVPTNPKRSKKIVDALTRWKTATKKKIDQVQSSPLSQVPAQEVKFPAPTDHAPPMPVNEKRSTDAGLVTKDPEFLETLMKKPMAIRELVGKRELKTGDWVQTRQSKKGNQRKAGEWGKIVDPEGDGKRGKVKVAWAGELENLSGCTIMNYCRNGFQKTCADGTQNLKIPVRLGQLAVPINDLKEGDMVQCGPDQGKSSWNPFCGKSRKGLEWGEIIETRPKGTKRVNVHWDGGKVDWSNCEIIACRNDPRERRRRMAVRKYSSHRDSPVRLRLLEKIVAAQD